MSVTSDLTPLLTQAPAGEGVRFGQGKLLAWNPTTLENQVDWRGTVLTNLPVLNIPAASAFQPGQKVALLGWAPGGGASSWAILGSWVTPGTDAAEQAVAFMQTTLAKQLAAQIFAERIHVADGWGFQAQTDSITWSDGGLGANNPTLTDIEITDAGFALVAVTGQELIENVHTVTPGGLMGAQMSVQISGATTVSPDSFGGGANLEHRHQISSAPSGDWLSIVSATMLVPQVLNPGLNTFEARYISTFGGNEVFISNPSIVVIAF